MAEPLERRVAELEAQVLDLTSRFDYACASARDTMLAPRDPRRSSDDILIELVKQKLDSLLPMNQRQLALAEEADAERARRSKADEEERVRRREAEEKERRDRRDAEDAARDRREKADARRDLFVKLVISIIALLIASIEFYRATLPAHAAPLPAPIQAPAPTH